MRKQRIEAVQTVMPLFRQAETSTDDAATETANCIAQMLHHRAAANLPIATGVPMLRLLADALSAQIKARELFIEAHQLAPAVVRDMGLERAFGDFRECPPASGELTALRLVETAA